MGTPQANPDGYVNASISTVEGFKHADFLLAHGSGEKKPGREEGKERRTEVLLGRAPSCGYIEISRAEDATNDRRLISALMRRTARRADERGWTASPRLSKGRAVPRTPSGHPQSMTARGAWVMGVRGTVIGAVSRDE